MAGCTRRGALKATAALGLTCTCAGEVSGVHSDPVTNVESADASTDWQVLTVSEYPFDIRYRSGYQNDAKTVKEWAIYADGVLRELYSFEFKDPITFDLYPASEYDQPHGNMSFNSNDDTVQLVTPSEYDGGYSNEEAFFRHGVTHEYVHAVQNIDLSFHTHAAWYMEGLAEAVSVYHTTEDIYKLYHENHHRSQETQADINRGFGYLLGVNEYVYRGSMHFLRFMLREYGSQAVFEITTQDANNMIEAVEKRLGTTPLDLEAAWLKYAQIIYGGNYTDAINRLGETVEVLLSVKKPPYDANTISIHEVLYVDDGYQIAVYDTDGSLLASSPTFSAGDWAKDIVLQSDHELTNPQPIEVQLHHATESGPGDPIEMYGEEIAQSKFYAATDPAISFAEPMVDGDTSINIHAFASAALDAEEGIYGNVTSGDARIGHFGISTGDRLIGQEVQLKTDNAKVPLSAGQPVTLTIVDDATGDILVEETREVRSESNSEQESTATPVETTATTTATATATLTATIRPTSDATPSPTPEPSVDSTPTDGSGTTTNEDTPVSATSVETTSGGQGTPTLTQESPEGSSPSETNSNTAAENPSKSPTTTEQTPSVSTPGFGVKSALGSIAGGIAVARWLGSDEEK